MKSNFTEVAKHTITTVNATLSTDTHSAVISFDVEAQQAASPIQLLAALVFHIKAVNVYVDPLDDTYVDFYMSSTNTANGTLVRIASMPYIPQLNSIGIDYLCDDKTVIRRVLECYLK